MHTISFLLVSLAAMAAWGADTATPVVVSAASSFIGVAPDSLATVYGNNLATVTESASLPWPARLGDISVVYVMDSVGKQQTASLLYVSPTQMNLWIPSGTAPGPASLAFPVTGLPLGVGTAALRIVPVNLQKVAPGLFSLDSNGLAAATAVRVVIPTQTQSPVPVFTCDASETCAAVPIDVGVDAPVYLSLYGTGIRGASSLANVAVTIGSTAIQPTYAGPQITIPGLDQVNVPLPLSLRGSGLVNVVVTVDGVSSNAVRIAIQ